MGWSRREKGLRTSPRISRVTTPRRASSCLAEDDRGVGPALGQRDLTLGHAPLEGAAVGQAEGEGAARLQLEALPHLGRQQGVGGPAVDQEPDGLLASGPPDLAVDEGEPHAHRAYGWPAHPPRSSGVQHSRTRFSPAPGKRMSASALSPEPLTSRTTPSPHFL